MRIIVASLALAAALVASAPAAAQTAKLLAESHLGAGPLNAATAQVQATVGPYATDALVLVSAQGASKTAAGGASNRGIAVDIVTGGRILRDDSFEAQASNMTFRAAVSHSFLLKAGASQLVTARTLPTGTAGSTNTSTVITMDLAAIAVAP